MGCGGAARQSEGEETYRDLGRLGSVPGGGTRGAEAEAPKQHTHERVPAAAAASGGRALGGGAEEAAASRRGRRINNRDRRSRAGCGWRGARAGAQRPPRSCTRRRVSRFLGGSRCLALPLPPPGSVCVSVCVSMCVSVRWRARAPGRARVLLAMQTVHTLRSEPPLLRGAGWGKGRLGGF